VRLYKARNNRSGARRFSQGGKRVSLGSRWGWSASNEDKGNRLDLMEMARRKPGFPWFKGLERIGSILSNGKVENPADSGDSVTEKREVNL
jgi:hypothetical protein